MSDDSDMERTEPASSQRLEKAREEADVPRSRELATVTMLIASGGGLWAMGDTLFDHLKNTLRTGLTFNKDQAFDPNELFRISSSNIIEILIAFAPFCVLLLFVAIASPLLIGGWVFSVKAFMPKFSKLNPISGIANLISKNSGVELFKAIAKSFFVGGAAWLVIKQKLTSFASLGSESIASGVHQLGYLLWSTYIAIVMSLVVIAIIDVVYQLWHYADKLKMTREEVKQEARDADGNPETKAKIRQQQREMSRRRMMTEIPNADVIVTNPTHYAVALQYAEGGNGAPRVIAKGSDIIAAKIREIGAANNIPVLEAPPLARALHEHAEIGDEIPEALYSAVAEVLAYVFQLKSFNNSGGVRPIIPTKIDVPAELDPLNNPAIKFNDVGNA